MQFTWDYEKDHSQQVKYFLKEKGISKGLLAKIKFQGGQIKVNDQVENVLFSLAKDDKVTIVIPAEGEHETVLLDETSIDIVYEDEHVLVVNKPAGVSSIPAQYHPNGTMANRVKAYYKKKGYENQVIHVVTRLDRDTSGLMLFAKHGFAHAKLDMQLREKKFVKKYQALVSGRLSLLYLFRYPYQLLLVFLVFHLFGKDTLFLFHSLKLYTKAYLLLGNQHWKQFFLFLFPLLFPFQSDWTN